MIPKKWRKHQVGIQTKQRSKQNSKNPLIHGYFSYDCNTKIYGKYLSNYKNRSYFPTFFLFFFMRKKYFYFINKWVWGIPIVQKYKPIIKGHTRYFRIICEDPTPKSTLDFIHKIILLSHMSSKKLHSVNCYLVDFKNRSVYLFRRASLGLVVLRSYCAAVL